MYGIMWMCKTIANGSYPLTTDSTFPAPRFSLWTNCQICDTATSVCICRLRRYTVLVSVSEMRYLLYKVQLYILPDAYDLGQAL